jgi:V/A-type H+-transporting ATPase subunit D
LLLAAELLAQLKRYESLRQQQDSLQQQATRALGSAISCHGLQGLSVYPAPAIDQWQLDKQQHNFMGVYLMTTRLAIQQQEDTVRNQPCYPTPEAQQCRELWLELIKLNAILAGVSTSIHRLLAEYRKTERRARALENIILPELDHLLIEMTSHLEEMEQEDAVRTHLEYGNF